MRRFAASLLLAWGLAASSALAASPPSPPPPPASGPGSEATAFPATTERTIVNPGYAGAPVTVIGPAGGTLPERLPVVLFAHGWGAETPRKYKPWLEHVARQGAWVVFPVYPPIPSATECGRYEVLWTGLEAAVKALADGKGPAPDLSRVGFMGHSMGGGAAPAMAARAAARSWGSAALWIECFAPWYDLDASAWPRLPPQTLLLCVGYEDDAVCDPAIAAGFLAKAATVPADRKTFVLFHGDAHGEPALRADHLAPLASPPDALDTRGTWRLDDALRAYALTGSAEARARVLGTGPETTGLGAWSDGVAVQPLTVGPAALPRASRVFRFFTEGGPVEEKWRTLCARESCCVLPLPPPSDAPSSRLPASERIIRPAPKDGWPAEFAAASAGAPLCVVFHRETSDASRRVLAALDGEAKDLEKRGIRTLRLEIGAHADLVTRLGIAKDPSVLLFAKGGELLLWREGEEPHLVSAILDLVK